MDKTYRAVLIFFFIPISPQVLVATPEKWDVITRKTADVGLAAQVSKIPYARKRLGVPSI
jgi:hypothetical protein